MSNLRPVGKTGAVRNNDAGKPNFVESKSWIADWRYGKYMRRIEDRKVFPPDNWRKGIEVKEYEKSLIRHLDIYMMNKYEGQNIEPEVDHLAAMRFNLDGIMHEQGMDEIVRFEKLSEQTRTN